MEEPNKEHEFSLDIQQIESYIETMIGGQKHDPSWTQPMPVSLKERYGLGEEAMSYLKKWERRVKFLEEENKNLKIQLEEMRGKVKEAWEASCEEQMKQVYENIIPGQSTNATAIRFWTKKPNFEQWSKENNI